MSRVSDNGSGSCTSISPNASLSVRLCSQPRISFRTLAQNRYRQSSHFSIHIPDNTLSFTQGYSIVRTIFAVVLKALAAGIRRFPDLGAIHQGWRLRAVKARSGKYLEARAEAEGTRNGVDAGLAVARERARRAGDGEVAVAERNSIVLGLPRSGC